MKDFIIKNGDSLIDAVAGIIFGLHTLLCLSCVVIYFNSEKSNVIPHPLIILSFWLGGIVSIIFTFYMIYSFMDIRHTLDEINKNTKE